MLAFEISFSCLNLRIVCMYVLSYSHLSSFHVLLRFRTRFRNRNFWKTENVQDKFQHYGDVCTYIFRVEDKRCYTENGVPPKMTNLISSHICRMLPHLQMFVCLGYWQIPHPFQQYLLWYPSCGSVQVKRFINQIHKHEQGLKVLSRERPGLYAWGVHDLCVCVCEDNS
jgi:hypothetical protein